MRLQNGKGLKYMNRREKWYGGGYCGICGSREVVPVCCRYWDCDDGWRVGVLCEYCADECRADGPKPGDYAYQEATDTAMRADCDVAYGDSDSAYANSRDRQGWK